MPRPTRHAFALPDLAATIVLGGVLFVLAAAGLGESRRQAQLDESIANLKRFGSLTQSYAADNASTLWTFSWKGGEVQDTPYEDLEFADTDIQAAANQAVHILRTLGEREDMPKVINWLPHISYRHLVLNAYAGEAIPTRWVVSPADHVRLNWQDDPENKFDQGFWLPLQPEPTPVNKRWPYSSSYESTAGAWDYYQSELNRDIVQYRTSQSNSHQQYFVPVGANFDARAVADVAYPGGKVHMFDSHQRHFGPLVYYFAVAGGEYPAPARVPMLFFDGAAGVRATNESNPGWKPTIPTFQCMNFLYSPAPWEPDTTDGSPSQFCHGFYKWTRGGLLGVDYGALPLDTGQPNPGECPF